MDAQGSGAAMGSEAGESGKSVLMRFLEASERGDREAMASLAHEDVLMEWPQSGERFRGRENALAAMAATEVKPEPAGEPRIVGAGSAWMLMMPLRYGDETYHYVGVFEIEGGKIKRSTEYFGAPFPPQEGRARFAERD